ncbi:hypothetical protein F443_22936 [Phytophthora nicotianae P1569]|uniref:ZSWIM1/3 RNaseH-like domain-containing protein n=1 Tax=Phytophthora nicotianae P1569 TaxID=1317065 RepID=V9DTJ2_PHYNI|nr:hypothetical protein F443_22936 [Phytophthora nicotianae P1569]
MPGVELLVEAQAGTSSVYDYIRSNSNHCVTMDDVRSMISRLRSVELSDNDAVSEMIVEFNLESSKNVSTVNENARGDTGVISFTSGQMRAMLNSFPEVIQLDCTHKTNQYNYQLLSMVAMDQYGQGQPIQYSLLETNSDWNMAKAFDHFKRANERWKSVRIVIVDKAMKEIDVIRQKLPEARILLCHFHVIKWLHNTIRNSRKFGVYEEEVLVQMRHNITNMTYARTVADYEKYRGEFEHLACRGGRTQLWTYFKKNWDSLTEMWVMAHRVDQPHFNNHTNNRVESLFSKLKRTLKGKLTMRTSLEALFAYQKRLEEDYRSKVSMPGTLRDVAYTEEMNMCWKSSCESLTFNTCWIPEEYLVNTCFIR